MRGDLVLGGNALPRAVRQTLAAQQQAALVHAGKVHVVAACTEVAVMAVANLTNLEANLIHAVPLAERRIATLVDQATIVMGAQIARLAWQL